MNKQNKNTKNTKKIIKEVKIILKKNFQVILLN